MSDTKGIQRIRVMAGSGKTIVLARKAVELHMAHRNWTIVVTYSTRALRNQLVNLISKFYSAKNDGAKYDKDKIKIMQAWGAATSPGVYYEICLRHGISPLNFSQAKNKYNKNMAFSKACLETIKGIKKFQKMYDCILIDEAQDFDKNFMNLCLSVLGEEKRLIYAYDELQKLNEETMPMPKEIFGQEISNDTPLTVCYRNQANTIVTAHAIGMGLYRKNGLIQIPGSSDVWETIGYTFDNKILEGESVELYRTKETSPELLKCDSDEIIDFCKYDDFYKQGESLLKMIKENISKDQLLPSDIMIIDMDTIGASDNRNRFNKLMEQEEYKDISIHLAGTVSPEDSILLYDRSLIQFEFIIENNIITKQRMLFIKKHNKIWDKEEIVSISAVQDIDFFDYFFESEGIPTMIRIDYDQENSKDCVHPISHMTLSNCETCRIPIKSLMSCTKFVLMILYHFYDLKIEDKFNDIVENTITENEKNMIHLNWT